VLNVGGPGAIPQLETYRDVNTASKLPYVCEADVAIRIETLASGSSLATGKVLTYGAKPESANADSVLASAQPICRTNFGSTSGNVVCKENGWDKGRALSSDLTQQEGGFAARAKTAVGCSGSGTGSSSGRSLVLMVSPGTYGGLPLVWMHHMITPPPPPVLVLQRALVPTAVSSRPSCSPPGGVRIPTSP
jgi:hypothetical protein